MRQLLNSWSMLDLQRKVVLALTAIAVLVVFIGLARLANTSKMSLLYSGLDARASAGIVTSLEQRGSIFEVRGNAIYIDANDRDRVRMELAGEGLPSSGIAGYELLDTLSGFGTTSQMFDAAYWRAKEGELARTILASARITMARVHIANPVNKPFERGTKSTASVTVTSSSGALNAGQAEAIQHLVASAVSGLSPDQVAVIDSDYGVILQPGQDIGLTNNEGELDARAQELRSNVERLLSARLGQGNVIVEVMVEARNQSETITERILDPDGTVAISSDSLSNSQNSNGSTGGAVTVASNLPDGGAAGGDGQTSTKTETRERINYEISETLRERIHLPGEIARLSVAVLINHEVVTDASGNTTVIERSVDEIQAFQALVQSAVGFNENRGDVVTIKAMQFPQAPQLGTVAAVGMFAGLIINIPLILQMLFLGLVAMALGLFVVKPILTNQAPQLNHISDNNMELGNIEMGQIDTDSDPIDLDLFDTSFMPATADVPALDAPKDAIDMLRDTIAQRSEESGQLLRSWIESKTDEPAEQTI